MGGQSFDVAMTDPHGQTRTPKDVTDSDKGAQKKGGGAPTSMAAAVAYMTSDQDS